MNIGFQFTTQVRQQSAIVKTLTSLAEEFGYSLFKGDNWATVEFCHLGDLCFSFEPKKKGLFSKSQMICEANTGLVGAGFHVAAINFIDILVQKEKLVIDMTDETDYFTQRDFQQIRKEHFYSKLNSNLDYCFSKDNNLDNISLCWDCHQYMPEPIPHTIISPLGRFSVAELISSINANGISSFAQEFFIWNELEKDARFYRNSALAMLWEDCYFQPSIRSEFDNIINNNIIKSLEQAASMDSSLAIPKAEYFLLCKLHDCTPINLDSSPDFQPKYPIGYRHGLVTYPLGNTDLTVPGSFLMVADERGTLWYDGQKNNRHKLHVSAFNVKQDEAQFDPNLFDEAAESIVEFAVGVGQCQTAFMGEIQDETHDDDEAVNCYYQSIAQVVCRQQTTIITANFDNPNDKILALELFKKIQTH